MGTHRTINMKSVILLSLVAVALAIPQRPIVQLLRDDRVAPENGYFRYGIEADNGISVQAEGEPGSLGQTNMQGSYRLPLPDGTFAEVRFVADENGFRAESPILPTPHPLPLHAIEQIRIAEEQRRNGITFE